MARTTSDNDSKATENHDKLTFQADGQERIELPSADFIADAKMVREGDDLVLETPNGEVAVIEGYFSAEPAPLLQSTDGSTLTPNLVDAFARSPSEFAANGTASDESPVGAVEEVKGAATVTRADGTVETITNGTPIYQGDIIQTDAGGAVNIIFMDETSMAVSENARLAIDEYTYDPKTESGTTNFSVLRGVFVFTSGLIGRDDPDDVKIDTPVGSIGIRGTIIAGEILPGGESNISVLEGAIVVTNGSGEMTLTQQFETVRLSSFNEPMRDMGVLHASDISARFSSVSDVNPSLFSMINDAVKQESVAPEAPAQQAAPPDQNSQNDAAPQSDSSQAQTAAPDALASIDSSVASLNTSAASGLPSAETVTGQPSTGLAGSAATGGTSSAATGTNAATAPVATAPASTTGANTVGTAPFVTDTTQALPVNPNTTTPTTPARPVWADINLDAADSASHHLITDGIDNKFGYSISALGDIDNDGFDDFVVGKDSGTTSQNHSYVFHGSVAGITNPNPLGTTVTNLTDPNNFSNSVVAGVGDFNGDGKKDFAVGQESNGTGVQGQVTVNAGSGVSYYMLTTQSGTGSSGYGASIDGAGDFDNDGYADIIIGSPNGASTLGLAKIMYGDQSSFISEQVTGAGAGDQFGSDVSGLGDFNGDGYSDVVVGAPGGDYATIFFGYGPAGVASSMQITGEDTFGTEVAGLGDINGDGYSDLLVGTEGNTGGIYFGGPTADSTRDVNLNFSNDFTVSGGGAAGDFNGDGYKDFAVSLTNNTTNVVESYVVFGKGNIGGTIDYNYLQDENNALKMKYSGAVTAADDIEIASIGDVNGDGYDDLGIGVPDANGTDPGNGGMFVVYGRETGNTYHHSVATASNQSIVGDRTANNALNDGGFDNVSIRGGASNDTLTIHDTNFLSLHGGGGTDMIGVVGDLDFSSINFEEISSMEGMRFDGADAQAITLTLENLFNLLKSSDNGTFKIEAGGANNHLNLFFGTTTDSDLDPTEVASALEVASGLPGGYIVDGTDGGSYNTFKIGGYTLMIDQAVTVDVQ